ncbi:MAG: sterol desaturase family protein [Anaerolineae bacterium]|nr:sterol desaturase family protein [Anaerolineae bacterium]
MECVAWFTHKYVMHGFLWILHEDHHRPVDRGWQKNDLFALFFSAISFLLIVVGLLQRWMPIVSLGLGMALYGIGYVLFHDIMFHRRIPGIRIKAKGAYLKRIVRAHKVHHQKGGQRGGISFGFLYAGSKYDE